MVHAIYAFVQSKRSGTTAEEQTNDGRKTEEVAPSVLQVVCPDSVRGWELLLVVGVEHRGGFKIVVLAVFHLEIFCKRGLASIYTLFLPYLQTLQVPSTESENTTLQRYFLIRKNVLIYFDYFVFFLKQWMYATSIPKPL